MSFALDSLYRIASTPSQRAENYARQSCPRPLRPDIERIHDLRVPAPFFTHAPEGYLNMHAKCSRIFHDRSILTTRKGEIKVLQIPIQDQPFVKGDLAQQ